MISLLQCLASLAAGVTSHVCFFRRGEHHLQVASYVQIFFFATALGVTILHYSGLRWNSALQGVAQLSAGYLAGLYTSLVVYRLFFHPLKSFSGPTGAKISNLWFSSKLRNGDAYRKVQELHRKYGDFVRIGSSDLSITHPKAVNVIYGFGSGCTKADWYDLTLPMISLQTFRIKALHDARRRVWSSAFSDRALRNYEVRIREYQNLLLSRIESYGGQSINVTKLFILYSFDVMGDLAFGKSFNMLQANKEHWAIELMNTGITPLAWMLPVWLFRLMTAIPGLTREWWRFIEFCGDRVDERRKIKPVTADIMTTLLQPFQGREPTRDELSLLKGDSQLVVVAGSDTTAATLTHVFFELSKHPEHIETLRKEFLQTGEDVDAMPLHQHISKLDHLNGVIWETLRLHPPVPTALPRKTPPEGINIDGQHVPGNMTVWCPQFVIGRKENIYTCADLFLPERWYRFEDMVKDKSAWAPFSAGPYGCIGKPLALLNLRTTIISLIMRYDVAFAPGDVDQVTTFEDESTEHFTLSPGKLNLVFRKGAH